MRPRRPLRSIRGPTAAEQTLQRPTPQTDEGKAAQRAMRTRLATDEDRLTTLFADVVAHARVFQGGGNEVTTSSLHDAVETAAHRSLIRLSEVRSRRQLQLVQGRRPCPRWCP